MTDEQLAAIRTLLDDTERARARLTALGGPEWSARRPRAPLVEAAHALLAEVERLRAREAAMREIVEAVATEDVLAYEGDAGDEVSCPLCEGEEDYWLPLRQDRPAYHEFRHDAECPVTKARAFLTTDATEKTP